MVTSENQVQPRKHLVDITTWECRINAFWVFKVIKMDDIIGVDPYSVDSQVV
jgi:hypothetical protein